MVLLGTQAPVSFFAYPDKPNWLTPEDCEIHTLAERDENIDEALALLIERLGAKVVEPVTLAKKLPKVSLAASLDQMSIGAVLGRHLPEHAVIVDEAQTNGFGCAIGTQTAAPHDLLGLTGGSIGWGLGAAVGAAIAHADVGFIVHWCAKWRCARLRNPIELHGGDGAGQIQSKVQLIAGQHIGIGIAIAPIWIKVAVIGQVCSNAGLGAGRKAAAIVNPFHVQAASHSVKEVELLANAAQLVHRWQAVVGA